MATTEQDIRLNLLNTLLTTPHRRLEEIRPVHEEMVRSDPRFYVRLAAWYNDTGDVRDHKEMFAITLILSDFAGHRDVGLAMLRAMPPYQVARVVDFIHGKKVSKKVFAATAGGTAESEIVESVGLFRNPPRSLRTEVERYLREREADEDWFDSTVLVARKSIKRLYALLHVKPAPRAQQVLFDEEPPAGSRLHALKVLAKAASPAEQARAIVDNAIPYRIAATVVTKMTPEVLAALVERMSPQEAINNLASLKARGAMDDPAIKALIEQKLEAAQTGPRVSALKAEQAIAAAGITGAMKASLEKVADARVKAKGRISRPTALFVDKSGSMSLAIELGKRIGAMISAVCEKDLFVYAFDTMAYPVERAGDDMASWERSFAGIAAGGGTSCGVALETMRLKKQYVEQIILVTDEEENTAPLLADTLKKYRETVKADPAVCIVRIGQNTILEQRCRDAGIPADVFQFAGDYYSLPNLVPLLAKPSKLELLIAIMDYPLPKRKSA